MGNLTIKDITGTKNINILEKKDTVTVVDSKTKIIKVFGKGPRGPKGNDGGTVFKPTGSFLSTTSDLQVTGSFSATTFYGSGTGLTNIPVSGIANFYNELSQSMFPYSGKVEVTGSFDIVLGGSQNNDFFIIRSGSLNALTVTNQGVLRLGEFDTLPTAVAGGLAYSQANFWVGVE